MGCYYTVDHNNYKLAPFKTKDNIAYFIPCRGLYAGGVDSTHFVYNVDTSSSVYRDIVAYSSLYVNFTSLESFLEPTPYIERRIVKVVPTIVSFELTDVVESHIKGYKELKTDYDSSITIITNGTYLVNRTYILSTFKWYNHRTLML